MDTENPVVIVASANIEDKSGLPTPQVRYRSV